MAPHVTDDRTCYFFATKEKALEAVRARKWRIHKAPRAQTALRLFIEYLITAALLFPVVYVLFREPLDLFLIRVPALCLNPYTAIVTTIFFTAFAYPFIKNIILIFSPIPNDFALGAYIGTIITNILLTFGFSFAFMSMFPSGPTATDVLASIEANRSALVQSHTIFPGMTVAEYYYNGPHIHPNGERDFNFHANDPEFQDAQRAYKRLVERASREAKLPFRGQNPYRLILNKANDLWLERQAKTEKS